MSGLSVLCCAVASSFMLGLTNFVIGLKMRYVG